MKKIKLVNISELGVNGSADYFPPFNIEDYKFYSQVLERKTATFVYTHKMAVRSIRINQQNAFVQFNQNQQDSIIFKGGKIGRRNNLIRKRKLIEDVLLLGSLLTGKNWALYSRRYSGSYPVTAANHLGSISKDYIELQQDISTLLPVLKSLTWQQKFDNGFHLMMLLNHSNIHNEESRFLSMIIIWEFLYAKISGKESSNLHEIMKYILEYFWSNKVNKSIFLDKKIGGISKNIIYVLRNQLAHSGKLPIDRPYAEPWMTLILPDAPFESIKKYFRFFDELTQTIVMKTMDIHPESRISFNTFDFNSHLNNFLSTGRL